MTLGIFWRAAALAAWFAVVTLDAVPFALADPLEQPRDKPVLTVSGKIAITNGGGAAQFDRAMLEGLGMVSFETTTPWYKEPVKFEGVPLAKLMAAVGATGHRIIAIGLNDYSAEVPMEDALKYNVIMALKRDGKYMPVRDKGPLFIVYPFDSDPELKSQKFYSRSVWEVARIEVK
jgi:hypothetical protein